METMHAAGRRNLPPVPRAAVDTATAVSPTPAVRRTVAPATETAAEAAAGAAPAPGEAPTETAPESAAETVPTPGEAPTETATTVTEAAPAASETPSPVPATPLGPDPDESTRVDAGQAFVARLRAAGAAFAEAAGAESAVVREVVPPARHRRSRCRVVLRAADGSETDLVFVGERRRSGAGDQDALDEQISEWLTAGQQRDEAWLVADPGAADGLAVDLTAWTAGA